MITGCDGRSSRLKSGNGLSVTGGYWWRWAMIGDFDGSGSGLQNVPWLMVTGGYWCRWADMADFDGPVVDCKLVMRYR